MEKVIQSAEFDANHGSFVPRPRYHNLRRLLHIVALQCRDAPYACYVQRDLHHNRPHSVADGRRAESELSAVDSGRLWPSLHRGDRQAR